MAWVMIHTGLDSVVTSNLWRQSAVTSNFRVPWKYTVHVVRTASLWHESWSIRDSIELSPVIYDVKALSPVISGFYIDFYVVFQILSTMLSPRCCAGPKRCESAAVHAAHCWVANHCLPLYGLSHDPYGIRYCCHQYLSDVKAMSPVISDVKALSPVVTGLHRNQP